MNPNTIARAYRELELAGHVVGMRGRGTFPVPAAARSKASSTRETELRKIAARTLAECVRRGFTAAELVSAFEKRTP